MTTERNKALTDVCEVLEELGMTLEDVRLIAQDLPGEFEVREEARNEAAYERAYDPENIAQRGEYYRRQMIAAGRGRQLK